MGSSLDGTAKSADLETQAHIAAMEIRNTELEGENQELKTKIENLEVNIAEKDVELAAAVDSVAEKVQQAKKEARREAMKSVQSSHEIGGPPAAYGSEMKLFSRFLVKEYGSLDAGLEMLDLGMDEEFSVADWTDAILDCGYLESLSAQLFSILDIDRKNSLTCNQILDVAEDYIYVPITQDHIEREQRIWAEKQWQNEIAELQKEILSLQMEDRNKEKQLIQSVFVATQQAATNQDAYNELLVDTMQMDQDPCEDTFDTQARSTIRFDEELEDVVDFESDAVPKGKTRASVFRTDSDAAEQNLGPLLRKKSTFKSTPMATGQSSRQSSNSSKKSFMRMPTSVIESRGGSITDLTKPVMVRESEEVHQAVSADDTQAPQTVSDDDAQSPTCFRSCI